MLHFSRKDNMPVAVTHGANENILQQGYCSDRNTIENIPYAHNANYAFSWATLDSRAKMSRNLRWLSEYLSCRRVFCVMQYCAARRALEQACTIWQLQYVHVNVFS